jgi:hypothetical protein
VNRSTRRGRGLFGGIVTLLTIVSLLGFVPAHARITSLTYTTSQPYGTQTFGSVGEYQQLDGTAIGELTPGDPLNAIITDIDLAPRTHGKVQYSFTFSVLMPVDLSKSNRTLVYDIVNRGNKVITNWNNVIPNPPADGDGFLESQGFILAWSGWEADLIQVPGRIQNCRHPRLAKYRCISPSPLFRLQHEDLVGPGFGTPDFALTTRKLSHAGVVIG